MKRIARILGISVLIACFVTLSLSGLSGQSFAAQETQEKEFLSVAEIESGTKENNLMEGEGSTVFRGIFPEKFDAKINGVLKFSPEWGLILARLGGGPLRDFNDEKLGLEVVGVISAMSGSPIYIDEKLVGALGYSVGKETIEAYAGITPINLMIESGKDQSLQNSQEKEDYLLPHDALPLEAPLLVSGFKKKSLENLVSFFEKQGFNVGGVMDLNHQSGSAEQAESSSNSHSLRPGSGIAVLLMRGDFTVGSIGTATYIKGKKVYALGHPLLGMGGLGNVDFPFYQSWILMIIASREKSFKLSGGVVGGPLGTIKKDTFAGIVGVLDEKAQMIPVKIHLKNEQVEKTFNVEIVNHRILTKELFIQAFENAMDRFQSDLSFSTLKFELKIKIKEADALEVNDIFVTEKDGLDGFLKEFNQKIVKNSLDPLFDSPFKFELESVEFDVEISKGRKIFSLDQAFLTKNGELLKKGEPVEKKDSLELALVLKDIETQEKYLGRFTVPMAEGIADGSVVRIRIDSGRSITLLEDIEYPQDLKVQIGQLTEFYFPNNQIYLQILFPLKEELETDSSQITSDRQKTVRGWKKITGEERLPPKGKREEIKLVEILFNFEGVIIAGEVLTFRFEEQKEREIRDI